MTNRIELREKLESQGEAIHQLSHEIEKRLDSLTDWRLVVRQSPFQSMGIAVALGFLSASFGLGFFRSSLRQLEWGLRASALAFVLAKLNQITSHQPLPKALPR